MLRTPQRTPQEPPKKPQRNPKESNKSCIKIIPFGAKALVVLLTFQSLSNFWRNTIELHKRSVFFLRKQLISISIYQKIKAKLLGAHNTINNVYKERNIIAPKRDVTQRQADEGKMKWLVCVSRTCWRMVSVNRTGDCSN